MCPYIAGGRSRRGSPKAGTTVCRLRCGLSVFWEQCHCNDDYMVVP